MSDLLCAPEAIRTSPVIPEGLPERQVGVPLEMLGRRRDEARLLVAHRSDGRLIDAVFSELPRFLDAGDVLVVNTSATLPAAVPTQNGRLLHLSTQLPGGLWTVELREPCGAGSLRSFDARPGEVVELAGGGRAELLAEYPVSGSRAGSAGFSRPSRLWTAALRFPETLLEYLAAVGRPIRYGCSDRPWPLSAYQTVFADEPGSAEMPSAARAFTPEVVTGLVVRGVVLAPLTLHTGVSSQEAGEPPYPEVYRVPEATAQLVNGAKAGGHRVIAVGTTVTRALETVADASGRAHPGQGWTDLVITPQRGVRIVDGILTGWHDPEASHLQLLEAVAGRTVLEVSYAHALMEGYRWHEFGDLHLLVP